MLISELIEKLQIVLASEGDRQIGTYRKEPNEPFARIHEPELCTAHEATPTRGAHYKVLDL